MNWIYQNQTINNISFFPEGVIGFVYQVITSDNKKYIGKKSLYSKRKRNFGKKESAKITDKRKKKYEYVIKESDWQTYTGSSELMKVLPENITITNKEILEFAYSDKHLTYLETKYLFNEEVLEKPTYYNANILGKFFRKDIII